MSRHTLFLVLFLCTSTTLGQVCPPAIDMAPCLCEEESKSIKCVGMQFPFDIKSVFDRVGPLVNESVVFNSLSIGMSIIPELPAGTVESLKFLSINIYGNTEMTSISPDAFNLSTGVTTDLYINQNILLSDAVNKERDLFAFVSRFTKLRTLQIRDQLTAIPDDAFGPLTNLQTIEFSFNSIVSIGSRAFSQLTNLSKLNLNYNDVTVDGIADDAFEGISSTAVIDLEDNNDIDYLPQEAFKPLLDNANKTYVGGSHCSINGCNYVYLECDERANWICENQELYESKLNGFRCSGAAYEYVWDYCREVIVN